jgi:PHD/YefM family antitoxin component YafN of YafNO toxin-antitoxin module
MTYNRSGGVMKVITANVFDSIENDAEDLVITRSGHEPLVVMLKSEYDAWRETEYLSRGANGRELRRRIVEMEAECCRRQLSAVHCGFGSAQPCCGVAGRRPAAGSASTRDTRNRPGPARTAALERCRAAAGQ